MRIMRVMKVIMVIIIIITIFDEESNGDCKKMRRRKRKVLRIILLKNTEVE